MLPPIFSYEIPRLRFALLQEEVFVKVLFPIHADTNVCAVFQKGSKSYPSALTSPICWAISKHFWWKWIAIRKLFCASKCDASFSYAAIIEAASPMEMKEEDEQQTDLHKRGKDLPCLCESSATVRFSWSCNKVSSLSSFILSASVSSVDSIAVCVWVPIFLEEFCEGCCFSSVWWLRKKKSTNECT